MCPSCIPAVDFASKLRRILNGSGDCRLVGKLCQALTVVSVADGLTE